MITTYCLACLRTAWLHLHLHEAVCYLGTDQPTVYVYPNRGLLVVCRTSIDCEIDAILEDLPSLEKDTLEVCTSDAVCGVCLVALSMHHVG